MGRLRHDITFRGRVQGVGFRATMVGIARNFTVTGWVRNEPDGTVRCVAEGDEDELDRFVKAVQDAMSGYVKETKIDKSSATGEFKGFTVKY